MSNYHLKVTATDRMGHPLGAINIIRSSVGVADVDRNIAYEMLKKTHGKDVYIFVDRPGETEEPETRPLT